MPIYKLNPQLAGGATEKKDRHREEHRHRFWELPESDRYRTGDEWTEDANKQNRDLLRRVSSNTGLSYG